MKPILKKKNKIIKIKPKIINLKLTEGDLSDEYNFIITRHVSSELTNNYWIECCKCIRKFYTNPIIIIDDNSNEEYLTKDKEKKIDNLTVINSEFIGRGEYLPFYYMIKLKFCKKAIIMHDSCFIQSKLPKLLEPVNIFWNSTHRWDNTESILEKLKSNGNNNLFDFFKKDKWELSFGAILSISLDYLLKLDENYKITHLKNKILNREDRIDFERLIGLFICHYNKTNNIKTKILFCKIHNYCNYGLTWDSYLNKKHKNSIFKVWTGR